MTSLIWFTAISATDIDRHRYAFCFPFSCSSFYRWESLPTNCKSKIIKPTLLLDALILLLCSLCPALLTISKTLRLPNNIAGVTFLAFGNGAPDIFSSISGVTSSKPDLIFSGLFGNYYICIVTLNTSLLELEVLYLELNSVNFYADPYIYLYICQSIVFNFNCIERCWNICDYNGCWKCSLERRIRSDAETTNEGPFLLYRRLIHGLAYYMENQNIFEECNR